MKFPKPVKRDKIPKRLGRRRRSRAESAARAYRKAAKAALALPPPSGPETGGKRRSARARRPRAWGKMTFLRTRGCDVRGALDSVIWEMYAAKAEPAVMAPFLRASRDLGPCHGGTQVMHLGWKADPGGRRQAHDADTSGGCELHHAEMGTKLGGLGPWYVALGRDGQRILRRRLQDRGQAAWDALTAEERAAWDRVAEADRAARRRA